MAHPLPPAATALFAALDPVQLLADALTIQAIPAPTFDEAARASYIYNQFRALGLADITRDDLNNVIARLPGGGGPALLLTAHTDTVFPANTDLTTRGEPDAAGGPRIYGPGLGDNSLGVAGLLHIARLLKTSAYPLPGDLWLAANSGEEGLGDLRGMRGVIDRLGEQVNAVIVLEGMMFGQVCHLGIGVRRYEITVNTAGGHSWIHYGKPSAIHELMQIGAKLTRLKLPRHPRTTLNIGVVHGGRSVNTIADHATLQLDLRSMDAPLLQNLIARVETLAAETNRAGVQVQVQVVSDRPFGQLSVNHSLVTRATRNLQQLGVAQPQLVASSTDANLPLSRGIPAIVIGLTTGGNAHRTDEFIHTEPLANGLSHVLTMVLSAFPF